MSKIVDALRRAESSKKSVQPTDEDWNRDRQFRLVTIVSNKGGVGKTTIASNLAVYLRALSEDDPVLVFGLDDQTTLDRMFALDPAAAEGDIADALRQQHLKQVVQFGQYGVEFVPATRDLVGLRELLDDPKALRQMLLNSDRAGTVVIDTKSDFEKPTCAAITASDLTIVVVKDNASLVEARRTFDLIEKAGRPRESARILLSLVDMRVKYHEEEDKDVLAHLLSQIRHEQYPLFETFISRSPKVESLYTNPKGRAVAILQGAKQSVVHRQMIQLTKEVAEALRESRASSGDRPRSPSLMDARAVSEGDDALPVTTSEADSFAERRNGPGFWAGLKPR